MRFNSFDRTPRPNTPKWFKIFLGCSFAFFPFIFLLVGILLLIEAQSFLPALILVPFSLSLAILFAAGLYRSHNAYFEVEENTVTAVDFPFFKRRERSFPLSDIKKIKWQGGGRGFPFLVFKNHKNRTLFRTYYLPEIVSFFEKLGFEITC